MPDRLTPEHWRNRAAEVRALADAMSDQESREKLLRIAQAAYNSRGEAVEAVEAVEAAGAAAAAAVYRRELAAGARLELFPDRVEPSEMRFPIAAYKIGRASLPRRPYVRQSAAGRG